MPVYLRRYFWALTLGFIASASGMGMSAVNGIIGASIEPAPLMAAESGFRSNRSAPAAPGLDAVGFGHLFGIEPPPPPPVPLGFDGKPLVGGRIPGGPGSVAGADPRVDMNAEPVKSSLHVQLLATMVANDPQWSMAMIYDLDSQKTGLYLHGDLLRNCTIHDIRRPECPVTGDPEDCKDAEMKVIIINPDTHRLEYIDATPGPAVTTTGLAPLQTGAVPPAEANNSEGIKQLEKGKYEISRAKLDQTLANLNDLATQARIVPNFKNGTSNGFKLFSIQPGSLYSAIGIQNGDVITQINGLDINSPEKALEIYTRLKDASNVKVTYERNGQTQSSDYTIQ